MKNIILIAISLILIACGGGKSNSTTNNSNNNTETATVKCSDNVAANLASNSIQITVHDEAKDLPLPGVVVQVDNNGKCIFTDTEGRANFTELTTGPHDFHIFGQSGFEWKSYYNLNISADTGIILAIAQIKDLTKEVIIDENPLPIKSYIPFVGEIKFKEANSKISYQYFADKPHKKIHELTSDVPVTLDLQYGFTDAEGTSINDELWVFETLTNATNNDKILVDTYHMLPAVRTTTTQAELNLILVPLSFNTQIFTNLMVFNSMTLPTGYALSNLDISASLSASNFGGVIQVQKPASIPLVKATQFDFSANRLYRAYTLPFSITETTLELKAKKGNGSIWQFRGQIPIANSNAATTNFTFSARLTTIPSLFTPIDKTINWSANANIMLQKSKLQISSGSGNTFKKWSIAKPINATSITLPELPAGLVPFLTPGDYIISLSGRHEYNSTIGTGIAIEDYTSRISWTIAE